MKKVIAFLFLLLIAFSFSGQDVDYARKILYKLTSKGFHGRGYVKNGDQKAADYLAKQFKKNGLLPLDSTYFQTYSFPINTFPGKVAVEIDGVKLEPGEDFVISCSTPSVEGSSSLIQLPDTITSDSGFLQSIIAYKKQDVFLFSSYYPRKLYGKTLKDIKGIVVLEDKTPWWHISNGNEVQGTIWLKIRKDALPANPKEVSVFS